MRTNKQPFLDGLDLVMGSWEGPTITGGDFNLVRFVNDKSNGITNQKWVDMLIAGLANGP